MSKMDNVFADINELVKQAAQPLGDEWLDGYYKAYQDHVSTRLNYYRFLYLMVMHFKPAVAIELGVEFGLASAHMARAAATYGGTVIGVDHNYHSAPMEIVAYCKNYNYRLADTVAAFPDVKMLVDGRPVGLLFQDSSHHYLESKREFELYSTLMPAGSYWVCDDILPAFHDPKVDPPGKGMVEYFWELPGYKRTYPEVLNKGNTIGIVKL